MLIDTPVGSLFVQVVGDGPPLLLWPSLLTDASMWRLQVPRLSESHTVITLDPPGHGRSGPPPGAYTLLDCADAGCAVLDHLGFDESDWAGLSWGAMTGLLFALHHPDRLRRLALLDASARAESRRKLPSYHVMAFAARRVGAFGLLVDRISPLFFTPDTLAHRPDLVAPFREHLLRMEPRSIGLAVDAVIFGRRSVVDRLDRITAPTLVMTGDQDIATPPALGREMADGIGARFVSIPGAAHLAALERPDFVTQELLAHFG